MQRIDGYYLYQFGFTVHNLQNLRVERGFNDPAAVPKTVALYELRNVSNALYQFLYNSIFQLKLTKISGGNLLTAINSLVQICEQSGDSNEKLTLAEFTLVSRNLIEFETVLKAELGGAGIFLVRSKNAMDTLTLVEAGEEAFPPSLPLKVPAAISDAKQAMSCIAFELQTAAAFHLHRANEIVLGCYWDSVSNGKARPNPPTMGKILAELVKLGLGNAKVRSALRDIKDMHRNPTIHPEKDLSDVAEAINLYGAIRSVIGFMLENVPACIPNFIENSSTEFYRS